MAKRTAADQLDEAVDAILAGRGSAPLPADSSLAGLAQIAASLRDLPREDFRLRLKAELQARGSMTNTTVQEAMPGEPGRKGFHTVTLYLTIQQASELIDFVKQAFGGEELLRSMGSAGGIQAEIRIGDSIVMIGGGGAWRGTPMPTAIHFYTQDADAVYRTALAAGAVSIAEPTDQPYGDREAGVQDLAGNHWYIATHKGERYVPEGLRSITPYLHPRGAPALIEFLKEAFGAEEVARYQSPEGVVHHAKLRIGDSIVEMGEAHGPWQPMPTVIFLYVEDVNALYRRAVAAGAISIGEPADQPYGARVGAVKDPSENIWYIATQITKS